MGNTGSTDVSTTGISLTTTSSDEDEPGGCSGKRKSDIAGSQLRLNEPPLSFSGVATTATTKTNFAGEVLPRSTPRSISKNTSHSPLLNAGESVSSLFSTATSSSSSATEASSPDSGSSSSGLLKLLNGNQSSKTEHGLDVDYYLKMLFDLGSKRTTSKAFCLSPSDINVICQTAARVFMSQPVLLQLGAPVKVVGDLHGQFSDLMRIFSLCGMPPTSYLFLGDYVDRGKQSLETIMLLLLLKIKYPENIFLLRGNHECANVTKVYGFYDECKRRLPKGVKCWKMLVDVFSTLPIAATIGKRIFCVHGGLSPSLKSLDNIKKLTRPTDIPDSGLLCDLLWSDPDPAVYQWAESDRGVSYCFGKLIVERFCRKFQFDLIARGHMVVEDGYEFFCQRKLVTIFSAPNYCGEFGNWGAVMSVDKNLLCSFDLLKPNIQANSQRRKVMK